MASFNRVVLVGNLPRDVELRYTPQGTAVTDVGLAVNERVKRNDQWVDEANFFDVTLWGRLAEIAAEYLSKGSYVLIEGRLKQETWEQEGKKRSKVKVVAEKLQMLGSRSGGSSGSSGGGGNQNNSNSNSGNQTAEKQQAYSAPSQGAPPDDDVPF